MKKVTFLFLPDHGRQRTNGRPPEEPFCPTSKRLSRFSRLHLVHSFARQLPAEERQDEQTRKLGEIRSALRRVTFARAQTAISRITERFPRFAGRVPRITGRVPRFARRFQRSGARAAFLPVVRRRSSGWVPVSVQRSTKVRFTAQRSEIQR